VILVEELESRPVRDSVWSSDLSHIFAGVLLFALGIDTHHPLIGAVVGLLVGCGLVQFLLWALVFHLRVQRRWPGLYRDERTCGDQPPIVLLGGLIATGYGVSYQYETLCGQLADRTLSPITLATRARATTVSLPALLRQVTTKKLNSVIFCTSTTDVFALSLKRLENALRSSLLLAAARCNTIIILANFGGLARSCPVWWLRILFAWRARKVRDLYRRVVAEFSSVPSAEIQVVNIEQIVDGHPSADGMLPSAEAYAEIAGQVIAVLPSR